jgi:glutathione S-transferase
MVPSLGLSKPKDIELTYFDISGVAEKIRITLLVGGVPFKDNRVKFPEWAELKKTMPFGQLPLMSVDGAQFAQSGAMLQFAGKICGMLPRDPLKALRVDEAVGLDEDLRGKIRPSIYVAYDKSLSARQKAAKVKEMRAELVAEHLPFYLGHFEKMLTDSEYLAGDKPTIADAQFLSTVRWLTSGNLDHIPAECVDAFPKVVAFKAKMEAVPAVAAYLASLEK